jgi:hypothetical protein
VLALVLVLVLEIWWLAPARESRYDVERQDTALGTHNASLIEHEDEQEHD